MIADRDNSWFIEDVTDRGLFADKYSGISLRDKGEKWGIFRGVNIREEERDEFVRLPKVHGADDDGFGPGFHALTAGTAKGHYSGPQDWKKEEIKSAAWAPSSVSVVSLEQMCMRYSLPKHHGSGAAGYSKELRGASL